MPPVEEGKHAPLGLASVCAQPPFNGREPGRAAGRAERPQICLRLHHDNDIDQPLRAGRASGQCRRHGDAHRQGYQQAEPPHRTVTFSTRALPSSTATLSPRCTQLPGLLKTR